MCEHEGRSQSLGRKRELVVEDGGAATTLVASDEDNAQQAVLQITLVQAAGILGAAVRTPDIPDHVFLHGHTVNRISDSRDEGYPVKVPRKVLYFFFEGWKGSVSRPGGEILTPRDASRRKPSV